MLFSLIGTVSMCGVRELFACVVSSFFWLLSFGYATC